uniref:PAT complex subunit CCDC47 n=1 Tax=Plectus sambesii TaxID=2011161 RepID=A0A914V2V8_9BILA
DDSDEFAHLQDEDEFENFDKERVDSQEKENSQRPSDQPQPLKFADVPAHFRSNWTNYQVELLVLSGLVVYLLNYVYGKTKNQTLAYTWFEEHRELLEQQFAVVGDDGSTHGDQPTTSHLVKETDSTFAIWCSGRAGCQGMLVQLKLLKRQDLVSVISQMIRPKYDRVIVRVELDNNEMDSYVFALGQRKSLVKLVKEMTDLSLFTMEKKNADKLGLPASFTIFSEISEATTSMIDPRVTQVINKYEECIDYIHFSDQYSGLKPQEGETQTRLPESANVLVFGFNIPGKMGASERHIEQIKPLLSMVFYCLDKVR